VRFTGRLGSKDSLLGRIVLGLSGTAAKPASLKLSARAKTTLSLEARATTDLALSSRAKTNLDLEARPPQ
jgi:hypothetical protein